MLDSTARTLHNYVWRACKPFLLLAAAIALFPTASASAAAYTIVDWGTLGGPTSYSTGFNTINNSGQIVGASNLTANSGMYAFRTDANVAVNAANNLGSLGGTFSEALAVNGLGQAVGVSNTAGDAARHAFRTDPNGVITPTSDLGTLGGKESEAFAINDAGQVVGYADTLNAYHAFRTAPTSRCIPRNTKNNEGTLLMS